MLRGYSHGKIYLNAVRGLRRYTINRKGPPSKRAFPSVLPGGLEPSLSAPEADALSTELREQREDFTRKM